MSELDYWTGFRDAFETLLFYLGNLEDLLRRSRNKVEQLRPSSKVCINPSEEALWKGRNSVESWDPNQDSKEK